MQDEIHLALRNDIEELPHLLDETVAFLGKHDLPPRDSLTLRLVLEEIVTNIITHAYEDREPHEITVSMKCVDEGMAVVVEDDGREFNPLTAPEPDLSVPLEDRPPGGLGIHLIREFADRIEYRRIADRNRLEFSIGGESA